MGTVKGNQMMLMQCMLFTIVDLNFEYIFCIMDYALVVKQDRHINQTILQENGHNIKM